MMYRCEYTNVLNSMLHFLLHDEGNFVGSFSTPQDGKNFFLCETALLLKEAPHKIPYQTLFQWL